MSDRLDDYLAEIKQDEQGVTEGPWWFDETDNDWRLHGVGHRIPPQLGGKIPEQIGNHQILKAAKRGTPYSEFWPSPEDGVFIMKSRELVPRLRAAVERARDLSNEMLAEADRTGSEDLRAAGKALREALAESLGLPSGTQPEATADA